MKKAPSRRSEEIWQWPPTEWSASGHIPSALGKDPERINALILKYRAPLKAYLLAAFPGMADEAEELLQDFVEDRILKKGWLDKAERKRGRFRDFLKASLKNFIRDRLHTEQPDLLSMERLGLDLPAEENGSEAFDLEWAKTIVTEVLRRMEIDCRAPHSNRVNHIRSWEIFRLRLLQPILEGAEPTDYEELVANLRISSPSAAQNLLVTAKRIFSRHLSSVIAEYEAEGTAAKRELVDLRLFLRKLAAGKKDEKVRRDA